MSPSNETRAFAPATVSNLACGFDVLGLALEAPGDVVAARPADRPGVIMREVQGDDGRLPRDAERNTASVAAAALLQSAGVERGVELLLTKGMPLASGLGSSAASGVAAVVAVDALLRLDLPREKLLAAALEGEKVACGAAHADNAAPSLYGGFTLIRGDLQPEVIRLPVPEKMTVAVLHPHLEVATREARSILPQEIPLRDAVTQWSNLGALIAALFKSDWDLLGRSLQDVVAEPVRAPLVPGFAAVKEAALDAGALGASLSGSGPSIFALCRGLETAQRVAKAMAATFRSVTGEECDALVSRVNTEGARLL
jgi:homoserine kinase